VRRREARPARQFLHPAATRLDGDTRPDAAAVQGATEEFESDARGGRRVIPQ